MTGDRLGVDIYDVKKKKKIKFLANQKKNTRNPILKIETEVTVQRMESSAGITHRKGAWPH